MKPLLFRIFAAALSFAPAAAFAHPGHADGAPVMHELSHNLHYLVAMIAASIVVAQIIACLRQSKTQTIDQDR